MGRLQKITIVFLLTFTFNVFADEIHGLFMTVKGKVEVTSSKTGTTLAKVSFKVFPGDEVKTGPDGRAKIVMSDRNVLNLSPDTTIKIARYENNSQTGQKNVEIELAQGKIRSNVEQKYDGDKSQFQIKTPTAVAGVRGTQFVTSFDIGSKVTQVVTLRGQVTFASIDSKGKVSATTITIKKGEASSVKEGQSVPEPAAKVKKEELNQIDKSTASTKTEDTKGDKAGSGSNVADNGNSKEREPASNKQGNGNEPSPGKEGPSSSNSMVDSKDLDVGGAKQAQRPTFDELPVMPDNRPRQMPTIPTNNQNPVIDEIVRGKLNNTKVIVTPKMPN